MRSLSFAYILMLMGGSEEICIKLYKSKNLFDTYHWLCMSVYQTIQISYLVTFILFRVFVGQSSGCGWVGASVLVTQKPGIYLPSNMQQPQHKGPVSKFTCVVGRLLVVTVQSHPFSAINSLHRVISDMAAGISKMASGVSVWR